MIVVIIAGGSGTRLWPLSIPEYPKHLLTIVGDKSLLQNTFARAKKVTSIDKIYVSTEVGHAQHISDQLPEMPKDQIIIEPARRDTMPCILNALQFIGTRHDHDEPIASIHADHHIRDTRGFAQALKRSAELSRNHHRIVLMGMDPTQPATKYGYIQKGNVFSGESFVNDIKSFKEKPEYKLAKKYFESGDYLWNMGYFVAPYKVFESKIRHYADKHWSTQLDALNKAKSKTARDKIYLNFQKEPIDIALMEKVPDLLVVPGTFDWMDVGTFDEIHQVSSRDQDGNAVIGDQVYVLDSAQVYVRNDCPKRPVAVIGMDNVVVVNTEHGLLVMRTDQSQKVKQIAEALKEKQE